MGDNNSIGSNDFNPFERRSYSIFRRSKIDYGNPVTDAETFMHYMKASVGAGIFIMPAAFQSTGTVVGIFTLAIIAFCTAHMSYILVQCAHIQYKLMRVPQMSYDDVSEAAFLNGPPYLQWFAEPSGYIIRIFLFIVYYGSCSMFPVTISDNLGQFFEHYFEYFHKTRTFILIVLIPLILITLIPNLKRLAPISFVANSILVIGIGISFYYFVRDLPVISNRPMSVEIHKIPNHISIAIFATSIIGIILPLENVMKNPTHLLGVCGIIVQGSTIAAILFILIGFFGYVKYGDDIHGSVTLNLPTDEIPAQMVKVMISCAVFFAYGLNFYVCLGIAWNAVERHDFEFIVEHEVLANYILRMVLVIGTVMLAIAIPKIQLFGQLLGAFGISIVGLIMPPLIEIATYWSIGYGYCHWRLWKDILLILWGIVSFILGTYDAIKDISHFYNDEFWCKECTFW